jgi:hypothetical protein
MSSSNPPNPNTPPVFNNDAFGQGADPTIDIAYLNANYLRFPTAQGSETLQNIQVLGSATFNNAALPTSAGVLPLANDSSTKMPTTAWVQSAISGSTTNLLTGNNTWTGTNDFANASLPTSSGVIPASTDSSTTIPTTAWVQSAITNLLASANIWTNQNQFTISSNATYSIPQFSNDTTIANTSWTTALIAYYYNIILGAGVANPLQSSLLYGRTPYSFDLQFATFNPALTTNPAQVSFACSVINNTFAYSTPTDFVWWSEPQKPAVVSPSGANAYSTPAVSNFNSVQLSGDGQYALVCNDGLGANSSQVFLWAKDLGVNPTTIPSDFWWDSALSLNGQYQIVGSISGTKGLYVSNDYGASWNENSSVGVFTSVAVSAGGKYMVALDQSSGIRMSNDFGASFALTSIPNDWCNVCMSANGQYLLAVPNFNIGAANDSYISFDFGITWNSFGTPLSNITNCCMSDDGLMMVIFTGASAYQSFTYGKSWSLVNNSLSFRMMTGTQNGAKARFAQRNKYLLGWTAGGMPYYAEFQSNW